MLGAFLRIKSFVLSKIEMTLRAAPDSHPPSGIEPGRWWQGGGVSSLGSQLNITGYLPKYSQSLR